ncbi:MAG: ATP-dependent helicase [Candidatus Delongbacteria bacterium]|nr:ATP-dependent helicase [Candidatus Delongbacteria bacterium]
MVDLPQYIERLNKQQKDVVCYTGNVYLTACPGSGKTRTLVSKLAYNYLNNKNSLKKMVAITYTNRAADEMLERLVEMGIELDSIWIGTIHSFCIEFILRPYSMYCPRLRKGYRIIDDYRKQNYIQVIADDLNITLNNNDRVNTEPSLDGEFDKHYKFTKIVKEYHKKLKENKELDFFLILFYAYKIINENDILCQKLAATFQSIYIDEFQDTNNAQYNIISKIFKSNNSIEILFAGDVNQAIYTSLGGMAKTQDEIESLFGCSFNPMSLNGCYRSTQEIINFYSHFAISGIQINSLKQSQDNCIIHYNYSIGKEKICENIAVLIKSLLDDNIKLEDICILSPQWWLIFPIAKKLKDMLPDIQFDAPEITPIKKNPLNIMYNISKLALTQPGNRSWYRKRVARNIIEMLNEHYQISSEDIEEYKLLKLINSVDPALYASGVEYIKRCSNNLFSSLPINPLSNTNFSKDYEDFFENIDSRVHNHKLDSSTSSLIKSFKEKDGIVINTIHGVKGEEYKVVICFGLLKGYLPHWNNIYGDRDYGSEVANKLLYVLLSRAKEQLYLISENNRTTSTGNLYIPTIELTNIVFGHSNNFTIQLP